MSGANGSVVDRVYRLFVDDPDAMKSSYLYNSYRRGVANLMKPSPSNDLQMAAWKAGREFAAARATRDEGNLG